MENRYPRVAHALCASMKGTANNLRFVATRAQCYPLCFSYGSFEAEALLDHFLPPLSKLESFQSCIVMCGTKIPLGIQRKLRSPFAPTRP